MTDRAAWAALLGMHEYSLISYKINSLLVNDRRFIMAIRNWKDIPLFKDVTDEQWNDWHWQIGRAHV